MEEYYKYPWVIFTLKNERYGVATPYVRSMVAMSEVTKIPDSPQYIRGAIKIRDKVTPLVDLRNRLGMDSFLDKIENQITMLREREKDHRNWLSELESSVKENRPFKLATDHHKCKFGQWYNSYVPKSYEESEFLKKFEMPHKRIHEVAIRVAEFIEKNEQTKALELISITHDNELAEMINLFSKFIKITREQAKREITIVLENDKTRSAIAVDSIISVEKLAKNSIEPMPVFGNEIDSTLSTAIAKSSKDNSLILLLDAKSVIHESNSMAI
ncbi:chemotaxis protein CheW [Desulfobacterota bacterium M19]